MAVFSKVENILAKGGQTGLQDAISATVATFGLTGKLPMTMKELREILYIVGARFLHEEFFKGMAEKILLRGVTNKGVKQGLKLLVQLWTMALIVYVMLKYVEGGEPSLKDIMIKLFFSNAISSQLEKLDFY